MKSSNSKFGIVFMVVCNILIAAIIIFSCVLTINYDYPNVITKSEFIDKMENAGCSLIDMKYKYSSVDFYLMTDENTCPYLLSYAVFNDNEKMYEFYSKVFFDISNNNTNVTGKTNVNINSKYYEYSTSGDYYKIGVVNGNSILYATVVKEYREDIINLFDEFDYKYDIELMDCVIFAMSILLVSIAFVVFFVSMYKIEKKIRNNGNIGLIPFYNIWCLSNDVLGSHWYSLLLLIPLGNVFFIFMFCRNLAKVFTKSGFYSIGLMLLPTVFLPLLAFDDSVYIKLVKNNKINKVIEETKDFKLNGKGILRIIFDIIKWIISILFVLLGLIFLFVFFDSKSLGDMLYGLFFIALGLILCPLITKHIKKYKFYRICKWLIIILFAIFLFFV